MLRLAQRRRLTCLDATFRAGRTSCI